MSPLLRLLRTFVPKLLERLPAAVVPYAPLILEVIEEVFVELGGATQDFRPILAENQKLIDRLGDPDSFRNIPRPKPPAPPSGAAYLKAFDPPIPTDVDLILRGFEVGDRIAGNGESAAWMVVQKGRSLMGAKVIRTIGNE